MNYYAHIVRYIKTDPDSPGNLRTSDLVEAISNSGVIPEKFNVDIVNIIEYIELLEPLETFTRNFPGLVGAFLNRDISVFLFDSMESLQNYVTTRTTLPTWDAYETHRDKFLENIGLRFEIESPKEIISDDSMTPSQLVQTIV